MAKHLKQEVLEIDGQFWPDKSYALDAESRLWWLVLYPDADNNLRGEWYMIGSEVSYPVGAANGPIAPLRKAYIYTKVSDIYEAREGK